MTYNDIIISSIESPSGGLSWFQHNLGMRLKENPNLLTEIPELIPLVGKLACFTRFNHTARWRKFLRRFGFEFLLPATADPCKECKGTGTMTSRLMWDPAKNRYLHTPVSKYTCGACLGTGVERCTEYKCTYKGRDL